MSPPDPTCPSCGHALNHWRNLRYCDECQPPEDPTPAHLHHFDGPLCTSSAASCWEGLRVGTLQPVKR